MLADLMIAVTEDFVRSASSYIMVPLKSENLPSTSVTPMSVTEKPTLEWSASTENFSAAIAELTSRHATLAASTNCRNGWRMNNVFMWCYLARSLGISSAGYGLESLEQAALV